MAKPLTAVAVANARAKGAAREIPDGGCRGLYLIVRPTGSRSWCVRYRFKGMTRKLTLGPALIGEINELADVAPEIGSPLSLAAARELCTRALRQVMSGADPAATERQKREAERAAEADTLGAIAEEYLRREGPGLRTLDQRRADLKLLCEPLGQLPLEQIKRGAIVRVLDSVADHRGPVRADRVLNAAKRLLSWHANRGEYISVLAGVRRRTSISERARDRVLSDEELRAVWLAAERFSDPFGAFVRFVLLTATRRNEAGGMRRSELLAPDTWVIPRARYKTGKKSKVDMLIPLSRVAQRILESQPAGEFVFGRGKPLGNFARRKQDFDAACGVTGWTIHDLRRTARTLLSAAHDANGARITPDIAERCLGHALLGQRGTYDIHDYESEKREAFEALARKIELIVRPPPAASVSDLADARRKRKRA